MGVQRDGNVWHTIFYLFKDKSGISKAEELCESLGAAIKGNLLTATTLHCGRQNSVEEASFGADISLEYGFAFTFNSLKDKQEATDNNDIYDEFRNELDELRDTTPSDDSSRDFRGIFVMDWIHGETNRMNLRPSTRTKAVKSESVWHFVFFRFKSDEYTFRATPYLIDYFRDLQLKSVDPRDESRRLITMFSFGSSLNDQMLGFVEEKDVETFHLQYAFLPVFGSREDKEIYVGNAAPPHIGNETAHNVFKQTIAPFLDLPGGVFVFDFDDKASN